MAGMVRPALWLLLAAALVVWLAGCSRDDGPAMSTVDVHVADTAGVAAADVVVVAQQRISDSQFQQVGDARTNGDGDAALTLPENATVMVGLWKDQPDTEARFTWQTPFVVPVGDVGVVYSYPVVATNCPVVRLDGEPCPPLPDQPAPTSTG